MTGNINFKKKQPLPIDPKNGNARSPRRFYKTVSRVLLIVAVGLLGFMGKIYYAYDKADLSISLTDGFLDDGSINDADYEIRVIPKPRPFSVYQGQIGKRDLFQSLRDRLKPEDKVMEKALPALHQRIKLIGILLDQDSKAIVEDLKEKQIHFLSAGEKIGTALLENIQEDKVIFQYNNQRVEMTP